MAVIHGLKASGKNGALDQDELKNLIHEKSGRRADIKNCGICATHIQDMTSTSGQGGITTKYGGRSVFHISSGKRGGGDGCSVFFTLSEEGGAGLMAGIVAVGWHAGSDDHTYLLDWGKGAPFFTGNRLNTSVQKQKGYKS